MNRSKRTAVVHADVPEWVFTMIDLVRSPRFHYLVWAVLWGVSVPVAGGTIFAASWNLVIPVRFALPGLTASTGIVAAFGVAALVAPAAILLRRRLPLRFLRRTTLTAWVLYIISFIVLIALEPRV